MLAHELCKPLAPIATAAELLKLTALDEARVRETNDVISWLLLGAHHESLTNTTMSHSVVLTAAE